MTKTEIENSLASLGNCKKAVYESLLRLDVTGNHSPCSCPIANYLRRTTDLSIMSVFNHRIYTNPLEGTDKSLIPPKAVGHFIVGFDSGDYSLLFEA